MSRVQVGSGEAKQKNVNKPQREHFAKAEVSLKMKVAEFRVDDEDGAAAGRRARFRAEHFVAGQKVDITGHTQGKGFAGAHEALGLRRPARHPRRFALAPFARFDRSTARIRARSSRTRRWPATWVTVSAPSRTSKSSAPMPSAA